MTCISLFLASLFRMHITQSSFSILSNEIIWFGRCSTRKCQFLRYRIKFLFSYYYYMTFNFSPSFRLEFTFFSLLFGAPIFFLLPIFLRNFLFICFLCLIFISFYIYKAWVSFVKLFPFFYIDFPDNCESLYQPNECTCKIVARMISDGIWKYSGVTVSRVRLDGCWKGTILWEEDDIRTKASK